MSYRVAVFLIFVALMVRAVVRSRQKWVTGGLMLLSWLAALALASLDPTYRDNGAAAWEASSTRCAAGRRASRTTMAAGT